MSDLNLEALHELAEAVAGGSQSFAHGHPPPPRGPGFVSEGSWRWRKAAMTDPVVRVGNDYRRGLVSPLVGELADRNWGIGIVCADCLHWRGFRWIGVKDHFKRHLKLSLLQLEARCRCEACSSKNVRCYPWEA